MKTLTQRITLLFATLSLGLSASFTLAQDQCQIEQTTTDQSWWYGQWDESLQASYVSFTNNLETPTRYHYLEKKAANADQLVMLLHGFPELSWSWEKELLELGNKYHVIAPDLKGFYKSDKPTDMSQYELEHITSEIVQIAKCLGYEKFHLVGHDWGGAISWITGHLQKEHLISLTVLNAPHPMVYSREYYDESSGQKEKSYYMDMIRENDLWTTLKLMWILKDDTSMRDTGFYDGKRINRLFLDSWWGFDSWRAMFSYYRAMPFPPPKVDEGPHNYEVEVPTQLLWGTKDQFLGQSLTQGLEPFVKDVKVELFDQADHWVNHTVDVSPYIDNFIQQQLKKSSQVQLADGESLSDRVNSEPVN